MFIFIANILNWAKDKNAPQGDHIITSISVCNLVHEMIKSIRYLNIIYKSLLMTKIHIALFYIVNSWNFWFSTLLCVYFCLKIVNVKHTLYISMQRNFHKALPWLFISVIAGSVILSAPLLIEVSEEISSHLRLNASKNIQQRIIFLPPKFNDVLSFMILSLIAMLIFSISASAIIISLFKHMNQVQQNFVGFRGPNMTAHMQALRTVIFFLIANLITLFLFVTVTSMSPTTIWIDVIFPIFSITKVAGSWSLIKGNRNLDNALRTFISRLRCINKMNEM
ncbi:taste receptor type 2 member 40-like [Phyllobates terribilis]|uniref:taste receptor type 2 member 40-like n=1 Tax=Phyllobates terribilis TaxID=111132 RepID=UPI003CCAEE14